MNSPDQRRLPFSMIAYVAAIALFGALLATELMAGARPAGAASTPVIASASESSWISQAYAFVLWLVIPSTIFLITQCRGLRAFDRLVAQRRNARSDLIMIGTPIPADSVPVVRAKSTTGSAEE